MANDPQIVREEKTGLCWQVDFFGDYNAVVRRGSVCQTVPVNDFYERFSVVC